MTRVAIVYHSGYGHTARQAEAVHAGAASVPGVEAKLMSVEDMNDAFWAELAAADAIVFGAPTYMGGASAKFKEFADASSKPWFTMAWKDKIAGGFTNSGSLNGDKYSTLMYFVTLAMQHGMIWVGTGMPPANTSKAQRNDLNRMGSFIGAMAQSDVDVGPDLAPPQGDLDTAREYGRRIAQMARARVR
ncbi:MAG: flavodoxin family protein [Rhodocyclaceae bacterium]